MGSSFVTSRCFANEGLYVAGCGDEYGGCYGGGYSRDRSGFFSLQRSGIRMHNITRGFKFATWKVEGFTDVKLIELQNIMCTYGLVILCIQETHRLSVERVYLQRGTS